MKIVFILKRVISVLIILNIVAGMIFSVQAEEVEQQSEKNTETEQQKTDNGIKIKKDLLQLNAKSAVLIDADTGRTLYAKNAEEKMAMASTTKIMTCIIALEYGNLDDVVEASKYAASMPRVHLGMSAGDKYYLKDLLYALMLESYNDAAVAIAEHIGGSAEGFAKLMNEKAKQIGAYNSNFVTSNGLDAKKHYSTAYDMALIGAYAIDNKKFVKITNEKSYSFTTVDGKKSYTVSNKDSFLTMMDGAIGIKTGFTGKAGYCFVGAIKQGDHTLVSTVLGSGWPPNKSYKWKDTMTVMKYGLKNFKKKQVFKTVENYKKVPVVKGQKNSIATKIEGELSMLLNDGENVSLKIHLDKSVEAPVEKGQQVGNVEVFVEGKRVKSFLICSKDEVKKIDFKFCFSKMLEAYLPF